MGLSTVHDTRVHQAQVQFCTGSLFIRTSLLKNWPLSTQALWARVLCVVPGSIKLGYHSVLATYFITISKHTLSTFWNPAYPHSHSYSLITHSLNLPLNSLWLSQSLYQTLPHALNLPFGLTLALILRLPLALGLPLALLLGLPLALLLTLSVSLSQGMSRLACIFSLSIGYLWVFVFVNFVFLCIIWFWVLIQKLIKEFNSI